MSLIQLTPNYQRKFAKVIQNEIDAVGFRKNVYLITEGNDTYSNNTKALVEVLNYFDKYIQEPDQEYVFIDRSTEIGRFDEIRAKEIIAFCSRTKIPLNHIVYVSQCTHTKDHLDRLFRTLGSDLAPSWLFFHEYFWRFHEMYNHSTTNLDFYSLTHKIPKILCLNNKIRPHRVALVIQILKLGLLQHFTLSFNGDNALYGDKSLQKALKLDFPESYDFYSNFTSQEQILPKSFNDNYRGRGSVDSYPIKETSESFLQFVTESDYINSHRRITEKTLKPIIAHRPFIIFGSHQSLELVRGYGFQTFSPLINEVYDNEESPQKRLNLILSEVSRIVNISHSSKFPSFLDGLGEVCLFNQKHFCNTFIKNLKAIFINNLRSLGIR
jgi:hypothetical protein